MIHVVQYESIFKSPKECLAKLSLDLNLKINTQKLDEYISGFIDPSLEHHHLSIEDFKNTKLAPQILKALYSDLVKLSYQNQDTYEKFFHDNLLQHNKELENLSAFFKVLKNIHSKADNLSKEQFNKINQLNDLIIRLNEVIKKQEPEVSQLNKAILEHDGQIASLTEEIVRLGESALRLHADLDVSNQKNAQLLDSRSWKLTHPLRELRRLVASFAKYAKNQDLHEAQLQKALADKDLELTKILEKNNYVYFLKNLFKKK
jgi:hypothetical protein